MAPPRAGPCRGAEQAQPFIDELRAITNETIHLTIREGHSLIIVSREDSLQSIRTYVELGTRAPLHATSCGLAILARLPDDDVDALISKGLRSYADTTILDREGLCNEIERTRQRGYSVNASSWWRPQVSAIGAAIVNPAGRLVGAVAISITTSRFDSKRIPYYGSCAIGTTKEISDALDPA